MPTLETDVAIVGAGPTGLTLAVALSQRGVRTLVLERRRAKQRTSRAALLHARTLEMLTNVGVTARLTKCGVQAQHFRLRDRDRLLVDVGFDDLPTLYPYTLMIAQTKTETVLRERLAELGGQVLWHDAVTCVVQDDARVTATLEDGTRVQAKYLVGADGAHSFVRKHAGIPLHAEARAESFAVADVRLSGGAPNDEVTLYLSPNGLVVVAPLPDGLHRVVAAVEHAPRRPNRQFVQALLDARGPELAPLHVSEVVWSARQRVRPRLADTYRAGRVLIAGDAAHVQGPADRQDLDAAIQDSLVLAETLSTALSTTEARLNLYEAVRRPIARSIAKLAERLTRLATLGRRLRPVRNALLCLLARVPAFRRSLAWQLSGLGYR